MLKFIIAGDTTNLDVTISKNGDPIDLTDSTLYFSLKSDKEILDENASIRKVVTEHTDAINGKSVVTLSHNDTKELSAGTYFYDLRLKSTNGDVKTIVWGKVEVKQPITIDL